MSWLDFKEKLTTKLEQISFKQMASAVGFAGVMVSAFFYFRHRHHLRDHYEQRVQQIQTALHSSRQLADSTRDSLIIDSWFQAKGKLPIKLTLVSRLKEKQRNKSESVRNPFLPPFEQGLFITELGSSHHLIYNKYNIYPQHVLVVTKEYEPQSAPLTSGDFKQTLLVMAALRGLYFFNSGPNAGASQLHKHIQLFPSEARDLPLFRQVLEFSKDKKYSQGKPHNPEDPIIIQFPSFKFRHGLILLQPSENLINLKNETYRAYCLLKKQLIDDEEAQTDFNLIGCQHFVLLIPRQKDKAFGELGVNAVGFMGSVLFKDKKLLEKYRQSEITSDDILEDITFPVKPSS